MRTSARQLRARKAIATRRTTPPRRPTAKVVRISLDLGHGHRRQHLADDARSPDAFDPRVGLQQNAVRERLHGNLLDVVGDDVVASLQGGSRAAELEEREGSAGRCADLDLRMLPRPRRDLHDVPLHVVVHMYLFDRRLEREDHRWIRHRLDPHVVGPPRTPPVENLLLLLSRRIPDIDAHEEPVDLRLRQRVRAFVLDRILRREHDERARQGMRLPLEGRLPLLHRLEERGLRLRRRAVDLVREQDVREHRPLAEHELARLPVEDVRARDVRRQQVRRELHPLERTPERRRERLRHQRLREAGVVLDEDVAVAQDREEHLLEHVALADDRGRDLVEDLSALEGDAFGIHRHASIASSVLAARLANSAFFGSVGTLEGYERMFRAASSTKSVSARSPRTSWSLSGSLAAASSAAAVNGRFDRTFSRKAFRIRSSNTTWLYTRPPSARSIVVRRLPKSPPMPASLAARPPRRRGSCVLAAAYRTHTNPTMATTIAKASHRSAPLYAA